MFIYSIVSFSHIDHLILRHNLTWFFQNLSHYLRYTRWRRKLWASLLSRIMSSIRQAPSAQKEMSKNCGRVWSVEWVLQLKVLSGMRLIRMLTYGWKNHWLDSLWLSRCVWVYSDVFEYHLNLALQSYQYSTISLHSFILVLFERYVGMIEKQFGKRFENVSSLSVYRSSFSHSCFIADYFPRRLLAHVCRISRRTRQCPRDSLAYERRTRTAVTVRILHRW